MVSVPSQGILFSNKAWKNGIKSTSYVSVPSRGILFSNGFIYTGQTVEEVFPSPLGASYFQMRKFS